MKALLTDVEDVASAGTIGVPPLRRIAIERLNCESEKRWVSRPISGKRSFQRSLMSRPVGEVRQTRKVYQKTPKPAMIHNKLLLMNWARPMTTRVGNGSSVSNCM